MLLIGLMTGCKKPFDIYKQINPEPINNPSNINLENTTGLTLEDKARLADIPFIHDCEPRLVSGPGALKERKYILACKSNFKLEDTVNYYRAEMDYLGWKEELIVFAGRSCLVFRKPSKDCIIFIQNNNSHLDITMFISPRWIHG